MDIRRYLTVTLSILFAFTLASADYQFRFHFFVFYPPEILIYLLFFGAILRRDTRNQLVQTWLGLNKNVRQAIYFILVGALIATVFSPIFPQSIGALKAWVIAPILLFWLAVSFLKTTKPIIATVAFLAVALLIRAGVEIGHIGFGVRLSGYYESPNYFSALAAPLVVILLWLSRDKSFRILLPLGLLLLAAIVLTKSFGGMLGILAAALIGWFYVGRKIKIFIATTFILLVIVLTPIFIVRFNHAQNSLDSRVQIWGASALMLTDMPLTGVGLKGFEQYFPSYVVKVANPPLQWDAVQPHNLVLAIWLGLGILGLSGFTLLFWRCLRWTGEPNAYQLGLIALLGHGLVDTPYFRVDLCLALWFYLAAVVIANRCSGRSQL